MRHCSRMAKSGQRVAIQVKHHKKIPSKPGKGKLKNADLQRTASFGASWSKWCNSLMFSQKQNANFSEWTWWKCHRNYVSVRWPPNRLLYQATQYDQRRRNLRQFWNKYSEEPATTIRPRLVGPTHITAFVLLQFWHITVGKYRNRLPRCKPQ